MESIAGPGSAAPMHTHLEDEIFYVLDGTPIFALGEKIFDVMLGAMVVIPAGVPHA
jgi:mannose-6-phosphate isomerase-like protein (cupin superfamily)